MQYEPARKMLDGTCSRDNVILITTVEEKEAGEEDGEMAAVAVNETDQMDATYLAVNLAFLPDEKRVKFNMDTSGNKSLFSYQKPGFFGRIFSQ